jgi:hypothetical protein
MRLENGIKIKKKKSRKNKKKERKKNECCLWGSIVEIGPYGLDLAWGQKNN